MFTSPLLYHHSLPTVRTVTDPQTGRRYSVVDTGRRGVYSYPARRNTIAVTSPATATTDQNPVVSANNNPADPNAPVLVFRRTSIESAPAFNKGGTMSKVVRSVKNVTKGYSSVQVKVRNGTSHSTTAASPMLTFPQRPQTIHGVLPAPTWPRSPP